MRRRDFIFLVSSTAVPWPFAASAQQREGKLRHVGFLSGVSGPVFASNYAEFVRGMRELGYEEHKDFVTELRTAEGNYERFPDLARELVEQKVDILLTGVSAAIRYLQQATATIPIVMVYSTDPVKNGFVASLAHPGGNITGLAGSSDDTAPKQLELLATFVPRGSRIAVLGNPASPNYTGVLKGAQASAEKAGLSVLPTEARSPEEIANAFATLDKEGAQGVIVAGDAIFFDQRHQIAELALRNHLPSIFAQREFVVDGGLMSYGENLSDFFRRSAFFVDKIFKGANPASQRYGDDRKAKT
jgi:putative ABC transport system substrate-binding protein